MEERISIFMAWLPLAVLVSGVIAGAILWWLSPRVVNVPVTMGAKGSPKSSFLVQDGVVVDQKLVPGSHLFQRGEQTNSWDELRVKLANRFDGLPIELRTLDLGRRYHFHARDQKDKALLGVRGLGRGYLLELDDPHVHCPDTEHRKQADRTFQQAIESAPSPVFALNQSGVLAWSNEAFESFSENHRQRLVDAAQAETEGATFSLMIDNPETGRSMHLEICSRPCGDTWVFHVSDITRLVEADRVRSAFVQTLTKTFANLATGLAVFDRDQRLVLFNPAVLDLTGLSAEFLSSRPEVLEFFDRLRDAQVMPEPKDMGNWRKRIKSMLQSAASGQYAERWSLPDGRTYQVTGRPHPDGAVAFVFEDVSDEMSLTRQSRRQVEIRQAVLDQVSESIAVFSADGGLVFCNKPFTCLFGMEPDIGFQGTALQEVARVGSVRLGRNRIWDSIKAGQLSEAVLPEGPQHETCAFDVYFSALPNGFRALRLARRPIEATKPLLLT